jgi:hypothetical protein
MLIKGIIKRIFDSFENLNPFKSEISKNHSKCAVSEKKITFFEFKKSIFLERAKTF